MSAQHAQRHGQTQSTLEVPKLQCAITDHDCDGGLLQLKCGRHFMCVSGIQDMLRYGKIRCPYGCDCAMDFADLLRCHGQSVPPEGGQGFSFLPAEGTLGRIHQEPRMEEKSKRSHPGCRPEVCARVVPRGRLEQGLSTVEMCTNLDCPEFRKEKNNFCWDKGKLFFSIRDEFTTTMCPMCHCDRQIEKMLFTDCHVQVGGIELFQCGGHEKFYFDRSAKGATVEVTLDGVYLDVKMSTLEQPRLKNYGNLSPLPNQQAQPRLKNYGDLRPLPNQQAQAGCNLPLISGWGVFGCKDVSTGAT